MDKIKETFINQTIEYIALNKLKGIEFIKEIKYKNEYFIIFNDKIISLYLMTQIINLLNNAEVARYRNKIDYEIIMSYEKNLKNNKLLLSFFDNKHCVTNNNLKTFINDIYDGLYVSPNNDDSCKIIIDEFKKIYNNIYFNSI